MMAYLYNSAIYIGTPVFERETNLRYALNVMGCRALPYWLGTLAFDFIMFYITLIALFIAVLAG